MAKSIPIEKRFKATQAQTESIQLYKALMEEVKIRIDALNMAGTGKTGLPGPIVREFCFLQLRILCELIALGCLVAHGDIRGNAKLVEDWHAGTIVKKLEALHPQFFPKPVKLVVMPEGQPRAVHRPIFEPAHGPPTGGPGN